MASPDGVADYARELNTHAAQSWHGAVQSVNFGIEIAQNWNRIAEIAGDPMWEFTDAAKAALAVYNRKLAAPLIAAGGKFYDMARDGQPGAAWQRRQVAAYGGLALVMADAVDDVVDGEQVSEETREAFLFGGADLLLRGASTYEPANQQERVAFDIAQAFHRVVIWDDGHGYFQAALGILVPAALGQFTAQTLTEQLKATVAVGDGTFALASATVQHMLAAEQLPRDSLEAVDEAIRAFGVLAQCMDNADVREARADQQAGRPQTYLMQYLQVHGDTPENVRRAQNDLIDIGLAEYRQARSALSAHQRAILDALRLALELKFNATGYRRQFRPHGRQPHVIPHG